jgi:hypothetical protein
MENIKEKIESNVELFKKFNDLPDDVKDALLKIADELTKAMNKHTYWPQDNVIHAAAIVAEESGELIRAALQFEYEEGDGDATLKEAIQTGAMAVRFLICR